MDEAITIKGEVRTMIRREGTNEVFFQGIDYSNGRKPLLMVTETTRALVVKIPGGKHFASIGFQANHQAEYEVFLKLPDEPVETRYGIATKVMPVLSTPVRTSNEVDSEYRFPKV
jgi:hypothetical protein